MGWGGGLVRVRGRGIVRELRGWGWEKAVTPTTNPNQARSPADPSPLTGRESVADGEQLLDVLGLLGLPGGALELVRHPLDKERAAVVLGVVLGGGWGVCLRVCACVRACVSCVGVCVVCGRVWWTRGARAAVMGTAFYLHAGVHGSVEIPLDWIVRGLGETGSLLVSWHHVPPIV